MTYLLPATNSLRPRISADDLVCAPSQRTTNYSEPYAILSALPSNYIVIKYLENSHVTIPDIPLGKLKGAGIVSIFVVLNPNAYTLSTVMSWKNNGSLESSRLLTS